LSKKLETKGTLSDEHTGGCPKMNAGFGSEWDTLYKKPVPQTNLKWEFYCIKKEKPENSMTLKYYICSCSDIK
jgi:hypothetical protein